MQIIKRNGLKEEYDKNKIINAARKAFIQSKEDFNEDTLSKVLCYVESKMKVEDEEVENIQDYVEEALMSIGCFKTAKAYILFREERSKIREERKELLTTIAIQDLEPILVDIQKDFPEPEYALSNLKVKYLSFYKDGMSHEDKINMAIKASVELVKAESPKWEMIAARFLSYKIHEEINERLQNLKIDGFYSKLRFLTDENLYGSYILSSYTKEEIEKAYSFIDYKREKLFSYAALELLEKRYLIKTREGLVLEDPEEMFLSIALHLAMNEKKDRMTYVKKFYDMLSLLKVTMATPTLSNARKPFHQLSSCFIDTVPDSLNGIYRSLDNFAKVSKFGGGMGLYFGKVRANGSSIRGFVGAAGGVIRWIRLVNDTAVAVDQLGVRSGAVAVYLDAWHRDLPEFLNLRTNNGDDRMKAHDVFPAICYPDLFWRLAKNDINAPWHMMCPHEILTIKGYALEDYYGEEWEKRYFDCVNDIRIKKRTMSVKEIVRLILKSAVETGTPFAFNRDTVNKANPNKHRGMIYSSNLCTEIAQNMSEIEEVSIKTETEEGDEVIVTKTRPGDFVVCNLASLSLGNINIDDKKELEEITRTAVRALDNVIDLNFYPLEYARLTNKKYRSIGLGVSGYHHMLAKKHIKWESEDHLKFVDKVFETINYAAIEESSNIAKEKGSYSFFEGSDWQNGRYFEDRNYTSPEWLKLKEKVKKDGMRNAYLLAIAPTSSTSIIASTTAGVDPVMKRFFYEEKKGEMLARLAPELGPSTWWYYKNAHEIDQSWSVRASAVRQRHIDQAQSMNLYITNDYTMREVLNLYTLAWECGVKTIYYIRSKSLEVEECESCSS